MNDGVGATQVATGPSYDQAAGRYKALFNLWKGPDEPAARPISIPSIHPVSTPLRFSSYFGVRNDPFTGVAAMHAGVDIPGATGTPIHATADGIVIRAGRASGYGNLVAIDHGKGIETRYGHLSKVLVSANQRVKRGDLIGLMGSTGRSTGSHLHYEIRIAGRPVDPMPFLRMVDDALPPPELEAPRFETVAMTNTTDRGTAVAAATEAVSARGM